MQKSGDVCLSHRHALMITVPCLRESSRAPRPWVSRLRVLWLKLPLSWVPRPRVHSFSRSHVFLLKSPSRTSPVHTSPIQASNVTVHVPLLVTARYSLLIYTNTPLYVTNWQPLIWIVMAPPVWIPQYWTFPSLLTCYYRWVLMEDTLKTERNRML